MKTLQNFLFVLKRFKTSSILNILGLSVAFATFIIIMMQVDYDQNFDKCHENSDRIYRVELVSDDAKWAILPRPFADILFESSPRIVTGTISSFESNTFITVEKNGTISGYNESTRAVYPTFTKVFKFNMLEGLATALEEPNTALIPQSIAQKFFGNEPAIGKQIKFSKSVKTISGVYKDFPVNSSIRNEIYVEIDKNENLTSWGNFNYNIFVLLDKPGAEEEITAHFKEYLPKDALDNQLKGATIQLTKLTDLHFTTDIQYDSTPKTNRSTLIVLWAIAIAILLIAGINFVNFSLALVPRRIKSINTQKVLGASVAVQRITLVSEAIFLTIFAYLLSLFLVHLASLTPIAGLTDAGVNLLSHPGLIGITALVAFLTGLFSGLYPAFYTTSFQPALVLKGSFGLSSGGKKMRNILIGIQFIASLVLIISAGFIYLQNRHLHKTPVGYNKDQVIVTDINGTLSEKLDLFKSELKAFAGIESISFSQFLLGAQNQYMNWGFPVKGKGISFQVFPVDPSFLQVMDIQVNEGRDFREDDKLGLYAKYIFNEKAKKEFELELNLETVDGVRGEIIGFMPDIQFATFYQAPTPMAFFVSGTNTGMSGREKNTAYIKIKAGSDMYAAMKHIKKILSDIDSEYPFNVRFYDDVMNHVYQKEQRLGFLITLFSIIAIIISIIGVFGLVAFETQYRRKEISIRKVFGSSIEEVMRLFGKSYLIILGICFVIACPIAYFIINQWLEKFAYKISLHWWVFLLGGIIVLAITLITVSAQSYKAATKNPTRALNSD
jgi:putative ABC transport system permease protein